MLDKGFVGNGGAQWREVEEGGGPSHARPPTHKLSHACCPFIRTSVATPPNAPRINTAPTTHLRQVPRRLL